MPLQIQFAFHSATFHLSFHFCFSHPIGKKRERGVTWSHGTSFAIVVFFTVFHFIPSVGGRERDTIPKLNIDWLGHRVFIVSRTSRHSLHLHLFTTKCVPFFLLLFGVALSTSNRYLICCSLWRTIETLWTGIIFLFLSLSVSFFLAQFALLSMGGLTFYRFLVRLIASFPRSLRSLIIDVQKRIAVLFFAYSWPHRLLTSSRMVVVTKLSCSIYVYV